MACGIYRDLAVGVELNGADAWADQRTILGGASLGAPPDPLNGLGQNWGLPPMSPHAMREQNYEPFARLLRANMLHAGALRIDHVMALRRCFWIPRGASPLEGAYVRYPLEDLLAVVARESRRHRCAVIGEDLGTVPDGFRERLRDARILSSRLVYFERDWQTGAFLAPASYPRSAASSVGTHDLPPLGGWWTGDDLAVRGMLALYPDERTQREAGEDRWAARFALIDALLAAGAIDEAAADRLREDARHSGSPDHLNELTAAVHRFLAETRSAAAVVQLEDVLSEIDAVNVPGNGERASELVSQAHRERGRSRRRRALAADRDVLCGGTCVKAVVMAGGEGSRLRPLTSSRPKPLAPIANKPVMHHIVDLLRRHGITEIIATLHYLADEIENYFGDGSEMGVKMHYVVEDTPLGTAGAVKLAERHLSGERFVDHLRRRADRHGSRRAARLPRT